MNKIKQSKKDWDDLAEINAAWFNVPIDGLPMHQWETDEFFERGKGHVEKAVDLFNKYEIVVPRNTALDFGCGIGRVAQALTAEFEIAYGVDISEKMIDIANQYNRHGNKCKYFANDTPDLKIFQDCSINFIFSNNALQHNHPDIIKSYLTEFVRVLAPRGAMLFQIPIERLIDKTKPAQIKKLPIFHPKRIWNKLKGILIGHNIETRYYRLRKLGFPKKWLFDRFGLRPHIDMFFLEEKVLCSLLESHGCEIKEIEKYQYEDMIHARLLVFKPE